MKTSFSTLLTVLILISSCTSQTDKNPKKFILQGETIGQDSGIMVLSYYPDSAYVRDTAEIINGKFEFSGKISEPVRADLNGGNDLNRVMVYLEPGIMKISLTKDKYAECTMTGSKTQEELLLLNKMEKPINDRIALLREQLAIINDSIKNMNIGPDKVILEKKAEEIHKQWSIYSAEFDSIYLKFVVENPNSFVSPSYLRMLGANEVISLDSLKSIFSRLEKSVRLSIDGKSISEIIRKKENILIGSPAPDFKATDLNHQTVTLSQFKGKSVVLLDFWASWCVPCRESVPNLKTLYEKYHSKGLEIIAVSQDYGRKPWTDAVEQDSTAMWYHIPIAEKWPCPPSQLTNDDIYQNYFVQAIPATIIIDKDGKIIYRNVGYSVESEEEMNKRVAGLFE